MLVPLTMAVSRWVDRNRGGPASIPSDFAGIVAGPRRPRKAQEYMEPGLYRIHPGWARRARTPYPCLGQRVQTTPSGYCHCPAKVVPPGRRGGRGPRRPCRRSGGLTDSNGSANLTEPGRQPQGVTMLRLDSLTALSAAIALCSTAPAATGQSAPPERGAAGPRATDGEVQAAAK
jgi:hypothetical protein